MPESKYLNVGVELDYRISELTKIMKKHNNDVEASLIEIFDGWNMKQEGMGRKMRIVEVLRSCELNDLAERLLNDSFLPERKCMKGPLIE